MAVLLYRRVRFEGKQSDILEEVQPLLKSGEEKQWTYKKKKTTPPTSTQSSFSFLNDCWDFRDQQNKYSSDSLLHIKIKQLIPALLQRELCLTVKWKISVLSKNQIRVFLSFLKMEVKLKQESHTAA